MGLVGSVSLRVLKKLWCTDMPISQMIPIVSSDAKIFARTSHEWRMVSPIKNNNMGRMVKKFVYLLGNDPDSHIHWSQIMKEKVT